MRLIWTNSRSSTACLVLPITVFLLLAGCRSSKVENGPPLARVAEWDANPEYTQSDGLRVVEWADSDSPVTIVRTPQDRYPNGLAVCMSPFIVDWKHSNLNLEDEGYVVVRDVLVGGNPLMGIGRYASILIPVLGVERVEFVSVRYAISGLAKYGGHVQLRFVFKEDRRAILLGADGKPDLEQPLLDDLILSWEAWRPTQTSYSASDGLKPDRYFLTARMYAGCQRFLNDSLRGAVWDCYPLKLPDHPLAAESVLMAGLVMGDAVGRRSYKQMINTEIDRGELSFDDLVVTDEQLERLRGRLDWDEIPDEMLKEQMREADVSYHTFNRSCISLTHAVVDVAMSRMHDKYDLGPRQAVNVAPAEIPDWFDPSIDKTQWQAIKGAPGALFWILGNSELLPYKAYLPLLDAGLLETDQKGKPVMYRYGHKVASPYGAMKRNLM